MPYGLAKAAKNGLAFLWVKKPRLLKAPLRIKAAAGKSKLQKSRRGDKPRTFRNGIRGDPDVKDEILTFDRANGRTDRYGGNDENPFAFAVVYMPDVELSGLPVSASCLKIYEPRDFVEANGN